MTMTTSQHPSWWPTSSWLSPPQFWLDMSKERPWLAIVITGTSMIIATDVVYYLYKKTFQKKPSENSEISNRKKKKKRAPQYRNNINDPETERARQLELRKPKKLWNTVLFFPDPYLNDPSRSVTERLINYLDSAKMSIHLCMYLTSNPRFANIIRKKYDDGLLIQVVTDYDTYTAHNNFGPRVWKDRGIDVRMKATGFLMHHKFAIIDEEALITGSLNWTKQGMQWNQENVLITTNPNIVGKYMEEFYQLWVLFEPGR